MSDCNHNQWDFQRDYSTTSVRRYKCASCGCWGFRMPNQDQHLNKKQRELGPYKLKGELVREPMHEWHIANRLEPNILRKEKFEAEEDNE